jgi:hypothetical protein
MLLAQFGSTNKYYIVLYYIILYYIILYYIGVGRDSSVGIANRYGLDGPGIESRWIERFFAAVHQPNVQWAPDHSRG